MNLDTCPRWPVRFFCVNDVWRDRHVSRLIDRDVRLYYLPRLANLPSQSCRRIFSPFRPKAKKNWAEITGFIDKVTWAPLAGGRRLWVESARNYFILLVVTATWMSTSNINNKINNTFYWNIHIFLFSYPGNVMWQKVKTAAAASWKTRFPRQVKWMTQISVL